MLALMATIFDPSGALALHAVSAILFAVWLKYDLWSEPLFPERDLNGACILGQHSVERLLL